MTRPRWRPQSTPIPRRPPGGIGVEPGRGSEPSRIGEVLDRTLRSLGAPASASGVEVVFERWAELVGDAMAARTRPVHLDGDTLVVACDEPAVATHVRFLQAELVERLAQLSGERRVTRIEVRVDGVRRGPRPPRAAAARNPRRGR